MWSVVQGSLRCEVKQREPIEGIYGAEKGMV